MISRGARGITAGMRASLCAVALVAAGCTSVAEQQRERIAVYRADQSHAFVTRLAQTKVDAKKADLEAVVTAAAINEPLRRLEQRSFPVGSWTFTPTRAPEVSLHTGSALLRVTGEVRRKDGGRTAEVTIVGGLAVRWSEDGSHLFLTPSALAVVPTLTVSVLDFALGSFVRSFAEGKADEYLASRVGEIDLPVRLMLPFQRKAVALDQALDGQGEPGATLRYELPEASAQVKLDQLFVWPLEGRIVVLAFADVVRLVPVMDDKPVALRRGQTQALAQVTP